MTERTSAGAFASRSFARNVALSVDVDGPHVVVCCTDDGRGMTQARRREALALGHLGLAASTERVEALGGSLEIVSGPECGTRVRVLVPIARADTPPVPALTPATGVMGLFPAASSAANARLPIRCMSSPPCFLFMASYRRTVPAGN